MNTGRKIRRTAALCALAALLGTGSALADAVTVTAARLNVRTEASAESKAVAVVSKDETLQYVCEAGEWIRVVANGKTGYVLNQYVAVDQAAVAGDVTTATTAWAEPQTGRALVRVNMRALPMTGADIVKVIGKNDAVSLTGECGDWYVAQYGGKTGYVMKEYVQPAVEAEAAPVLPAVETAASDTYAAPVSAVTNTRVNLRAAATTTSRIVKVLAQGAAVTLTGLEGNWYKVSADGAEGYIARQFVTLDSEQPQAAPTAMPETETAYVAPVAATVNTRANMRAESSTASKIVKVIAQNAAVTLTGEKGSWYKVSYAGKDGYVYKQFVTLSAATPETAAPQPTATPAPQLTDSASAAETGYLKAVSATANVRVNMRADASATAAVVKVIGLNEGVSVLGEKGDWYKVSFDGRTGYVAKAYLNLLNEAVEQSFEAWTGVTSVEVNMRKTPEGDVMYVLKAGTELTVTGQNGSWYVVDYRGSTGYVAATYIVRKEDAVTVISPADTAGTDAVGEGAKAYVSGATVNIRAGAGTEFGVVGTVRLGDELTLYEQSGEWYRVNANGVWGYISAKFVSAEKPAATEAVTADTIGRVVNSDWWTGTVSTVFKRGATATVTDVDTGLSFQVKRTGGVNHADAQPLTAADTAVMHKIYGNKWQWTRRAIWVTVNGTTYAASMNGMPHGDSDSMPDNNFDGCFCIHFLNSRTHTGNRLDAAHQAAVAKALREGNK